MIVRARPTAALRHQRADDAKHANKIEAVGPCRFKPRAEGSHFDAIVRSIVYQQITGKAASTIIAQKLSQLEGVGQVEVGGSSLPAVRVEINPQALYKYDIGFEEVRAALAGANANRPKGVVEGNARRDVLIMEPGTGIEPVTSRLRIKRSTN